MVTPLSKSVPKRFACLMLEMGEAALSQSGFSHPIRAAMSNRLVSVEVTPYLMKARESSSELRKKYYTALEPNRKRITAEVTEE